ncbi:hypothetical protein G6O69_17410 [Pseudenhygromyxa sp. WMMC2535]|uniref:hypothetical protein n=1 Tax=Pseudenhygromyxa sp. WMMC2535 TaxID=2712867 RepID=UPI001595AB56|nr:hypothetical protein [Pseudenhygromyxa sp. WMMC2535]NVB39624.1 hypothetical protein [Pseudenhygromyxa sp. WMMC2535]
MIGVRRAPNRAIQIMFAVAFSIQGSLSQAAPPVASSDPPTSTLEEAVPPPPREAAPATSLARIQVDASKIGADRSERVEENMSSSLRKALRAKAYRIDDGVGKLGKNTLSVGAWIDFVDEDALFYSVHLELSADERTLGEDIKCPVCNEDRLVEKVVNKFREMVATWEEASNTEAASGAEALAANEATKERESLSKFVEHIGPLGITGLAASGAGLGTMVAGTVVCAQTSERCGAQARACPCLNPEGVVLAVSGGGALALGIAAVLVDYYVLAPRRERRRPGEASVSVSVSAGVARDYGGIQIFGRF